MRLFADMQKLFFIVFWAVVALLLGAFLSGGVLYFMVLLAEGPLKMGLVYTVILMICAMLVLASIALGAFGLLPSTHSEHRK